MPTIVAWIDVEPSGNTTKYRACYTFCDAERQPPATWTFPSEELAKAWIYFDAEKVGASVVWINQ